MSHFLAGLAGMATLAIWLRAAQGPARLRRASRWLALFTAALSGLLLLDRPGLADWQVLILPALPLVLARHVEAMAGLSPPARLEPLWLASPVLCLPYLLAPAPARQAIEAGQVPALDPRWLALLLAGVALYWLLLLAGTAAAGLRIARALRRHRAALAEIVAAPPGWRLSGVALLGAFLAMVFALQLADLAFLGAVLVAPFADLFLAALILGLALHGLTLRQSWPDWAEAVLAPAAPEPQRPADQANPDHAGPEPGAAPAYARSGLDGAAMARLLTRLDAAMQRESLWRAPGLSLADLAQAARAKPFHVSQALNQGRAESFFDYVNRYRVAEARQLLAQGEAGILEIGLQVGFNAKSTFNAAFRKLTGLSPSQWRAQAQAGQAPPPAPPR